GQSGNLAPADKKLYALRDVTATVNSIPLIASSIMSKKIAAGSDRILLDVKTGNGAFMKTMEDSIKLAEKMVNIGDSVGRKTVALITDMDIPLGYAIGNSLEVIEAVDTLSGKGPKDLTHVCIQLAANMLYLAEKGDINHCITLAQDAITSGKALEKLKQMVQMQGGDVSYITNTSKFESAKILHEVKASKQGFISHMQTDLCGIASVVLGAGRETKESTIDFSAGIVFKKKFGDYLNIGDTIAVLHTNFTNKVAQAEKMLLEAIQLSDEKPKEPKLIYARIEKGIQEIL
ncbi:MAG: thymidine phosphorylase, partial [Oscillospiraceae bacterium]